MRTGSPLLIFTYYSTCRNAYCLYTNSIPVGWTQNFNSKGISRITLMKVFVPCSTISISLDMQALIISSNLFCSDICKIFKIAIGISISLSIYLFIYFRFNKRRKHSIHESLHFILFNKTHDEFKHVIRYLFRRVQHSLFMHLHVIHVKTSLFKSTFRVRWFLTNFSNVFKQRDC